MGVTSRYRTTSRRLVLPGYGNVLRPRRPSYRYLVNQLHAAADHAGIPVAQLDDTHLSAWAQHRNWSDRTWRTATRVAHAHGLPVDPHAAPPVTRRPDDLLLARHTVVRPDDPPAAQRTALLAALCWQRPAPVADWRMLTFADLTTIGGDVEIHQPSPHTDTDAGTNPGSPTRCTNCADALATWTHTAHLLHPRIELAKLSVFVRLDAPRPVSARTVQLDWSHHGPPGITFDQYRAFAVDAGHPPISRGTRRR